MPVWIGVGTSEGQFPVPVIFPNAPPDIARHVGVPFWEVEAFNNPLILLGVNPRKMVTTLPRRRGDFGTPWNSKRNIRVSLIILHSVVYLLIFF